MRPLFSLSVVLFILLGGIRGLATEPVRLYSVSVAWQGGPTLTKQAEIVDKWTFVGEFKMAHLQKLLVDRADDVLAWNMRTQTLQVAGKLALFEHDIMDDVERVESINGLNSFDVVIHYKAPTLTMDVPIKLGKDAKTVRITVTRLEDGLAVP